MIAAATLAATVSSAALGPVLMGYDVVEYFSLKATDDGVSGSEDYQANLTSSDLTNNTDLMEVRLCTTHNRINILYGHLCPASCSCKISPGQCSLLVIPHTYYVQTSDWTFYFKSDKNRQEFLNDPWKYAPSWGGF